MCPFPQIVAVTILALNVLGAPPSNDGPTELFWRSARNCGPNALYLMLHGHGHEVSYQDVMRGLDIGPRGTSLLQLRDKCLELGIAAEVRSATPNALKNLNGPVILHVDNFAGDMTRLGHFIVAISFNEKTQRVGMFDGATAVYKDLTLEYVRQGWTGYLLQVEPARRARMILARLAVTFTTAAVVLIVLRLSGRARPLPASRGAGC